MDQTKRKSAQLNFAYQVLKPVLELFELYISAQALEWPKLKWLSLAPILLKN